METLIEGVELDGVDVLVIDGCIDCHATVEGISTAWNWNPTMGMPGVYHTEGINRPASLTSAYFGRLGWLVRC